MHRLSRCAAIIYVEAGHDCDAISSAEHFELHDKVLTRLGRIQQRQAFRVAWRYKGTLREDAIGAMGPKVIEGDAFTSRRVIECNELLFAEQYW